MSRGCSVARPSLTRGLKETARNVFVARQPIFNGQRRIFGYELLFRSGPQNSFDGTDGSVATAQVLLNSFVSFGISNLTGNRLAFVNMTRDIVVQDVIDLFPPTLVVPELLESVVPDKDVLAALARLKAQGFTIALDDFVTLDGFEELAKLADIIKVDFMQTTPEVQEELARRLLPSGVRLLAEKVETHEEFVRGVACGYSLFQGYFFAKPELLSRKEVPGYKLHYVKLLHELGHEEMELAEVEEIIKRDVSLSYRLLRYINSAAFGLRVEVQSVRHALTMLGSRNVRKWAALVALAYMGEEKPPELLAIALTRAHFCEAVARTLDLDGESELFITGLFSVLDAVADKPIDEVLEQVAIPERVRDALLAKPGTYLDALNLIRSYERADWERVTVLAQALGIDMESVPGMYLDALQWAQESLAALT